MRDISEEVKAVKKEKYTYRGKGRDGKSEKEAEKKRVL